MSDESDSTVNMANFANGLLRTIAESVKTYVPPTFEPPCDCYYCKKPITDAGNASPFRIINEEGYKWAHFWCKEKAEEYVMDVADEIREAKILRGEIETDEIPL